MPKLLGGEMKGAKAIFNFLLEAAARGERTALVTITEVIGGSTRAPGAHMAVIANGAWMGSLSGGCVEAAVVGEAQRAIAEEKTRTVRLGAGSPLIDIRLPCGGSVDLLFVPHPSQNALRSASDMLIARQAIDLRIAADGALAAVPSMASAASGWDGDTFVARHAPDIRLVLIGQGAEVPALARFGQAYQIPVAVFSPDRMLVSDMVQAGIETFLLKTPARTPLLVTDRRTAVVFLFHDHDWEIDLLTQVLEQEAFYVGAMGSRRTHFKRTEALLGRGVPIMETDRVIGPIGLIPTTRDPDTLALSILAQIAQLANPS